MVDHLATEEGRPTAMRLMVEQDPARDAKAVGLAVAAAEEMGCRLRGSVGALRVQRRHFVVYNFTAGQVSEHLAGGGLVEPRSRAVFPDRVEKMDDDVGVRFPRRAWVSE